MARRLVFAAASLVLAAALAGCASVPATPGDTAAAASAEAPLRAPSPADPFERWNRGVFAFNEAVDDAVLAPLARGRP